MTKSCRIGALLEELPRQTNPNFKFFVFSEERTDNFAIEKKGDAPAWRYMYGYNNFPFARHY
jgi:hypothetical protein